MGYLKAHARPLANKALALTGAHHTSVTCHGEPGIVWECHGNTQYRPGSVIHAGKGSTEQALEMSTPRSLAGVIYGITGVCHQMSNRILSPARLLVLRAGGFGASQLCYGNYGVPLSRISKITLKFSGETTVKQGMDFTEKVEKCINLNSDCDACLSLPPLSPETTIEPYSNAEQNYIDDAIGGYINGENRSQEDLYDNEILILFKANDIEDDGRVDKIIALRHEFIDELVMLVEKFLGQRKIDLLTDAINELAIRLQSKAERLIGPEIYRKLFGSIVNVVDPEIMQGTYESEGLVR